jgi:hypothetical protein
MLARFLGVPGGSIYTLVRILRDAYLIYETVEDVKDCVEGIIETMKGCVFDRIPSLITCIDLANKISGKEKRFISSVDGNFTDPATYNGVLNLYTNLTLNETLEGLIAYQLPTHDYVLNNSTGENNTVIVDYVAIQKELGYVLVIPSSEMDNYLSSNYTSIQITWEEYFNMTEYIFEGNATVLVNESSNATNPSSDISPNPSSGNINPSSDINPNPSSDSSPNNSSGNVNPSSDISPNPSSGYINPSSDISPNPSSGNINPSSDRNINPLTNISPSSPRSNQVNDSSNLAPILIVVTIHIIFILKYGVLEF